MMTAPSLYSTNSFVYLQKESAMEIWKDIKGYEGLYQVSNEGRVKALSRVVKSRWGTPKPLKEKEIREVVDSLGYSRLSLSKDGKVKTHKIHRLVAEAFLVGEGHINHIDGNKQNNQVSNLEFCTSKQNHNHAFESGLRPSKYYTPIVCNETGEMFESKSALARSLGVSAVMVSSYVRGNMKHIKGKTYTQLQ
jgi:hypothetical protein